MTHSPHILNHHLYKCSKCAYLNPLLALYCNAFDIIVWDKEYLVTVLDKVAQFRHSAFSKLAFKIISPLMQLIEDLETVFKKYRATYSIVSKTNVSKSGR